MPPVRRFLGAVAAALVAVCVVAVPPPAAAQNADVTLRLVSQSPWSSKQHRAALDVQVEITNNGTEPLRDLELQVGFGDHIGTQADFDAMLNTGVTPVAFSPTKTIHGSIDPGSPRTIPMTVDLTAIGEISQVDSQVYPAAITLLSESTVVTSLVTPVIYLVQPPDKSMLSSIAVPLPAPIAFGADDALVDTAFPTSLGKGGSLRATLDAIAGSASARHSRGVVDLITDPMVVTQARQVAAGYHTTDGVQVPPDSAQATQATRFIAELTSVVGATNNVETVADPFGNPNIPSMLATYSGFPAGETPTLETQLDAQRASASDVLSTVNATSRWGPPIRSTGRRGKASMRRHRPSRRPPAPRWYSPIRAPKPCSTEPTCSRIPCGPRRWCLVSSRSSGSRSPCRTRRHSAASRSHLRRRCRSGCGRRCSTAWRARRS
jgi:hypothetical protein